MADVYDALRDTLRDARPVAPRDDRRRPEHRRQAARRARARRRSAPSAMRASTASSPATRLGELEAGLTSTRHYGMHGEARERDVSVFIESFVRPPRMLIFGAVDFTAALARSAKLLGYEVTVCDARAVFATPARFPMADSVVNDWPDRHLAAVGADLGPRDAICVLTHDTKFDVPALVVGVRHERRLHRGDGVAAHAREAGGAPSRSRSRRRRHRSHHVAHRSRSRCPHTRGDRDRRSAPRSSRCAPGTRRRRCATAPVRSTDDAYSVVTSSMMRRASSASRRRQKMRAIEGVS